MENLFIPYIQTQFIYIKPTQRFFGYVVVYYTVIGHQSIVPDSAEQSVCNSRCPSAPTCNDFGTIFSYFYTKYGCGSSDNLDYAVLVIIVQSNINSKPIS